MDIKQFEPFVKFLLSSPETLAKFIDVAKEWYDLQGHIPGPEEERPQEWVAGETPEITTVGLTEGEIDRLAKGIAEGHVKEKAVAYIKEFLTIISPLI